MKVLLAVIAAFLLFSSEIKAETPVANFLNILPIGEYVGINTKGEECNVSVQPKFFNDEAVFVFVGSRKSGGKNITVDNFSKTKFNAEKENFELTKRIDLGAKFIENGIRTYRASNGYLYVATWNVSGVSEIKKSDLKECVLAPN